jgi:DNA-binding transcriptional ArsR family regulator
LEAGVHRNVPEWSARLDTAKPPRSSKTVRETLAYFLRNPSATDSLEGIARWRLLGEAIHRSLDETQTAIEWLVDRGYLLDDERRGTPRLFRLNPDKVAAAAVLVKAGPRKLKRKPR